MADKRIIEQNASTTVPDDAYFIFDSALLGTFKISQSALLDFFGNATITEVTKAQYDALPDTKLTDGVLYAIKDQETSYVVDIEVNGSSILDEDGIADLSVISKIEDEIANAIAEEYDSTHTYYNTELVFHEGVLYQCTATSTTGTWDSTKWNVVDIKDLLDNVSTNIGYLWNTISNTIAGSYDTSSTYNTGDYVIYSLKLYRCKDDGVTGAWNSSKWDEVNIPEYIDYVLENAGKIDDVKVDGTSVVTNKVAEIEIPVKDVQVKTDSTYDSVVDDNGNAKIDLSSVTAYGSVPNLPQAIATFKDGADAPMKSLKVTIEPVQDLHGYDSPWVGGAGKNKFDESILLECSGWTVSNGVYSGDSVSVNAKYGNGVPNLTFKPNTQYTFSFTYGQDGSAGIGLAVAIRYTDNTVTQKYCNLDTIGFVSVTSTAGKTIQKLELSYGANRTIHLSKLQLEEGSTATTFAPYSNICPIIGWDEANVNVSGVNVWDEEWEHKKGYSSGSMLSSDTNIASKNYIGCKPSTAYYFKIPSTLQIYLYQYDSNKDFIKANAVNSSDSLTTESNTAFLKFASKNDGYSGDYNNDISINYPSTDTEYHAYNGTTYTIDLDGTRYGGEVDVVNGTLDENQFCYKVTNDTNISKSGDYFEINNVLDDDATANYEFLSSFCKRTTASLSNMSDNEGRFVTNRRYLAVKLPFSTVEDIKAYLTSINAQIVYKLPTSTTLQQQPTSIKSNEGENIIWADTGDINDCVYRRDMSSTIDDIIARLEALEG